MVLGLLVNDNTIKITSPHSFRIYLLSFSVGWNHFHSLKKGLRTSEGKNGHIKTNVETLDSFNYLRTFLNTIAGLLLYEELIDGHKILDYLIAKKSIH